MLRRRAAVAAGAVALVLTACEPLETDATTGTSGKAKSQSTHRVEYQTSKGKSPSKRSVVVRSGSVARVSSRGDGKVSCRIVVDGRTVARKSGSGSVTCSARVGG
jgi:hypothetical protein